MLDEPHKVSSLWSKQSGNQANRQPLPHSYFGSWQKASHKAVEPPSAGMHAYSNLNTKPKLNSCHILQHWWSDILSSMHAQQHGFVISSCDLCNTGRAFQIPAGRPESFLVTLQ